MKTASWCTQFPIYFLFIQNQKEFIAIMHTHDKMWVGVLGLNIKKKMKAVAARVI